jgi:hypothetical protein
VALYIEGSDRFVTSTTTPIATGRRGSCRVGLSPTERARVFTAHTKLIYPDHRPPPWLTEDAARDRSNRHYLENTTKTFLAARWPIISENFHGFLSKNEKTFHHYWSEV